MRGDYPALAFIAGFYKLLGALVALAGVAGAVIGAIVCVALPTPLGLLEVGLALASLPFSILMGIGIVAAGEWIDLHRELVTNSRPRDVEDVPDVPLRWVA